MAFFLKGIARASDLIMPRRRLTRVVDKACSLKFGLVDETRPASPVGVWMPRNKE